MKKRTPANYYDFFLELPPTDYLRDIEIQDEYEHQADNPTRGLSEEQVSQIAADSLGEVSHHRPLPDQLEADVSEPLE